MPKKLPTGWVETTLGEVCVRVANVYPEDAPDAKFTYFDIGGIDNKRNRIAETKTFIGREAPSRARQSIHKDDILFSTVRTYLKNIALVEQEYPNPVASTGFTVIRAAEGVLPKFLLWQVLSEGFLQPLHTSQSGSSYPAVRDEDVFAQPIRLAPTGEQARIVAKLEALLSRVTAGEVSTHAALDRLERYSKALTHEAVAGELTKGWRRTNLPRITRAQHLKSLLTQRRALWEAAELNRISAAGAPPTDDNWKKRYPVPRGTRTKARGPLPSGWIWASIEQISERVTVGHVGSMMSEYVRQGIPFLRSQNVRANQFTPVGLRFIRRSFHDQLAKSKVSPGDVVVVRSGDVGTTCVIPETLREANCADLVIIKRPLINSQFISYYMNSAAQKHIAAGKVGVALTHFNTTSVALLPIAVPPQSEQDKIVQAVECRLLEAGRLAVTLNRQLARALATRQSILRDAFAGKLSIKEPTDEPALLLLERIRAARNTEAKNQRVKRMPKPKLKQVKTLEELEHMIGKLGKAATPERVLLAAGLGDDVDTFFDLLRAGRDKASLLIPVGKDTAIRRTSRAN